MKNIDSRLWFEKPIVFYDACTLYPLTVNDMVEGITLGSKIDGVDFESLFIPFIINNDFLGDCNIEYSGDIFDFFFSDESSLYMLLNSLSVFVKTKEIQADVDKHIIMVSGYEGNINKDNFVELADIICDINCVGKYKKVEEQVPHFETKEGYERWLKLQKRRKEFSKKTDDINIENCAAYIQTYSASYIPTEEILRWSYWRFIHYYNSLVRKINYEELFKCFATFGGADLRKDIDKLRTEIFTTL